MAINVISLDELQKLIKLLTAFNNGTVEFPVRIWWFSTGFMWVANVGYAGTHKRWCIEDGELVSFDHGRKAVIAERKAKNGATATD